MDNDNVSQPNKSILIMAAGTGGHVIPALTIAHHLQQHFNVNIHWLGTKNGIENRLIPPTNIPLHTIDMLGIRYSGIKRWLQLPFILLRALLQTYQLFRQIKPDVVIGFGGYVTLPGGIIAKCFCIPLIIHEQNAVAGLSNRLLAPFSKRILQGFPQSFPQAAAITVGNPIRETIFNIDPPEKRWENKNKQKPLNLLVLGGSNGAKALNDLIPQALKLLPISERPCVWHQTGKQHFETTSHTYQQLEITAKIQPFIDDMAAAYAYADLVIARAGALTVAELAAAGVGSILIPYPHAVDDHQTQNALYLVKAGAAECFAQAQCDAAFLAKILLKYIKNKDQLLQMAIAARHLHHQNAATTITHYCMES